jgi:hypothetical protein
MSSEYFDGIVTFNRLDGSVIKTGMFGHIQLGTDDVFDENFFKNHPSIPNDPFNVWIYTDKGDAWLWSGQKWIKVYVNQSGSIITNVNHVRNQ